MLSKTKVFNLQLGKKLLSNLTEGTQKKTHQQTYMNKHKLHAADPNVFREKMEKK